MYIEAKLADNILYTTVYHEGSHVRDRAAFVKSISWSNNGGWSWDASLDITVGENGRRAYAAEGLSDAAIEKKLNEPPYADRDLTKTLFQIDKAKKP